MVTGVADRADNNFDGDDRDEQVKYMGQFLQDGKFGCFASYFFKK